MQFTSISFKINNDGNAKVFLLNGSLAVARITIYKGSIFEIETPESVIETKMAKKPTKAKRLKG